MDGGDVEDEVFVVVLGDVLNDRSDGRGVVYFHRVGSIVKCLNSRNWRIKSKDGSVDHGFRGEMKNKSTIAPLLEMHTYMKNTSNVK